MTCQHCQTWILDDDHRCSRCGRRVRSTPARISPDTYPIAATATAPAYDYAPQPENASAPPPSAPNRNTETVQQPLFSLPASDPRVIPFDSLTSHAQRESIRARAAELSRPAPLKTEKVEARRVRVRRAPSAGQRRLDFSTDFSSPDRLVPEPSSIICDAPVAPPALRLQAAMIDMAIIAVAAAVVGALFKLAGVQFPLQKSTLPFLAVAVVTIPLFYKLLWTAVGRDSIGMQRVGLLLVDFDGHPPSQAHRYQRLFGSLLSFLAAGVGMLWALVDEDGLTWHDHMSSTFPTIVAED
jgi:uncharacterized RDD family membrane protein YckC